MPAALSVSNRVAAVRRLIKAKGRKVQGLRFISFDPSDSPEMFAPGSRHTKIALENLDKQPADAFEVFANMNDEVAVRQIQWTPFFHLV